MFLGIFPRTHWNDLLDSLEKSGDELIEIEFNRDGVIVNHMLVSFITELDEETTVYVTLAELLRTRTQGLVELKYHSNDSLLIEDPLHGESWVLELARPIFIH